MEKVSLNSRSIRLEFLTRLYFAQTHQPENALNIYDAQCDAVQSVIQRLETLLVNLPPEQRFNRLSLDLRLRQMNLIQEWMSEIKSSIIDPQE